MKNKKIVISTIFILVLICLTIFISTISYAGKIDPDSFKPKEIGTEEAKEAVALAEKIIGAITAVGTIIAVATTIGMGIKYMTGSIEEKAEYKKTMLPMLIGMILLFGISWIIKFIFDVVTQLNV